MAKTKLVIALRPGTSKKGLVYPGQVFEVPENLKGSWFTDYKPEGSAVVKTKKVQELKADAKAEADDALA